MLAKRGRMGSRKKGFLVQERRDRHEELKKKVRGKRETDMGA
jgi:hypothetical protein